MKKHKHRDKFLMATQTLALMGFAKLIYIYIGIKTDASIQIFWAFEGMIFITGLIGLMAQQQTK